MTNAIINKNEEMEKDIDELILSADVLIGNTISKINYELINLYWSIGSLINDYKKKTILVMVTK